MAYGMVIYDVRIVRRPEKNSVKASLSLLLGLMLFTSLVGFSYATPIPQAPQPLGNNSSRCQPSNNNQYSNATECESNSGGNAQHDPNPPSCTSARNSPDVCCLDSSNPLSPDNTCCGVSISPQSTQTTDSYIESCITE